MNSVSISIASLFDRCRSLARERPEFIRLINQLDQAAPLRSSWATIYPSVISANLAGSETREKLVSGLSYYLIDRYLEKHAEKLCVEGGCDGPVHIGANILVPTLNMELASIDFPSEPNGTPDKLLLSNARAFLLSRHDNRNQSYAFLDASGWRVLPPNQQRPHEPVLDGGQFVNLLAKHQNATLCVATRRSPPDAELVVLLERISTRERFQKALEFVNSQPEKVRQDDLARHLGLSKKYDRFKEIWEMLEECGANVQGPGRPRKK